MSARAAPKACAPPPPSAIFLGACGYTLNVVLTLLLWRLAQVAGSRVAAASLHSPAATAEANCTRAAAAKAAAAGSSGDEQVQTS